MFGFKFMEYKGVGVYQEPPFSDIEVCKIGYRFDFNCVVWVSSLGYLVR